MATAVTQSVTHQGSPLPTSDAVLVAVPSPVAAAAAPAASAPPAQPCMSIPTSSASAPATPASPAVPAAGVGAGSPGLPAPQPACATCQRTGGAQPWAQALELRAQILRLYPVELWRVGTIASRLHLHRDTVQRVLAQACVVRREPPLRPSQSIKTRSRSQICTLNHNRQKRSNRALAHTGVPSRMADARAIRARPR